MAFDIYGPQSHYSDDTCDYEILEYAENLDKSLPKFKLLLDNFYGDTVLKSSEVVSLIDEAQFVLKCYRSEIEPRIIKEKKIFSKDPEVFSQILDAVLLKDRKYKFLVSLIAICEEAIKNNGIVKCVGD